MLTKKGHEILQAMTKQYGPEKGKQVFYASARAGKITGVEEGKDEDEYTEDDCDCNKPKPPIRITIRRRNANS